MRAFSWSTFCWLNLRFFVVGDFFLTLGGGARVSDAGCSTDVEDADSEVGESDGDSWMDSCAALRVRLASSSRVMLLPSPVAVLTSVEVVVSCLFIGLALSTVPA